MDGGCPGCKHEIDGYWCSNCGFRYPNTVLINDNAAEIKMLKERLDKLE